MNLSGWGKYPTKACRLVAPRSVSEIVSFIKESDLVARGNGRSYGDSSFNTTLTLSMEYFNCLLNFDDGKGIVEAEAGVLLKDIIDVFLPKGWFPPVSPGTKFVTLGGMIAADVHGKNHHLTGSFGSHVLWLDIITAQGRIIRCGPNENCELFQATIGGMGLTGIILRAAFKLQRVETGWIRQQTLVASNLKHVMELFNHSADWEYTVAWVDCSASGMRAGRSLLFRGNHLSLSNLNSGIKVLPSVPISPNSLRVGIEMPSWLISSFVIKTFNKLYFLKGAFSSKQRVLRWDSFFYPLDKIANWNRLYGKRGFIQFQCVFPLEKSYQGLLAILEQLNKVGEYSCLSVLKLFGENKFPFSFPMEGYTLALDFPANPSVFELVKKLDDITVKYGGRIYLAKDALLSREILEASDPRMKSFSEFRRKIGAHKHFNSEQSKRLSI